jgi:hypothetical protein
MAPTWRSRDCVQWGETSAIYPQWQVFEECITYVKGIFGVEFKLMARLRNKTCINFSGMTVTYWWTAVATDVEVGFKMDHKSTYKFYVERLGNT